MSSAHLQYQFNTDAKGSLPFNLQDPDNFCMMIKLLRTLITSKRKKVKVLIFNKNDEPQAQPGGKVCS
jgi:hypothetical protein